MASGCCDSRRPSRTAPPQLVHIPTTHVATRAAGTSMEAGYAHIKLQKTSLPHSATAWIKTIFGRCGNSSHRPQRLFILSTFHILIFSPCNINKQGTGIMASAKNARSEFPHPSPSALYIFGPARGRTAAMTDLIIKLAYIDS